MKIKHLLEGTEPKLPGAPSGIKVMTPQQFVAKSQDEEKGVAEAINMDITDPRFHHEQQIGDYLFKAKYKPTGLLINAYDGNKEIGEADLIYQPDHPKGNGNKFWLESEWTWVDDNYRKQGIMTTMYAYAKMLGNSIKPSWNQSKDAQAAWAKWEKSGDAKHLTSEGVDEATKLPAQSRELKGDELTSYLDRIRKQEKSKTDKYKMPYIHRSSVMGYYDAAGQKYNVDAIKNALAERPKALLKKNEKMKHSDGELEQFFNIGFAALTGIALDENTNELIIVNTCPGAGSCKIDCFAMKGGKIQFQGPWLSDGRILTYLLNDPDGFFNQLKAEIEKEEKKGKKGGYKVSIRWHDAGDFFSPEYAGLAFKLARELPNVDFYAYTKIAGVALGEKPDNFMINWSEGAHPSQERQVKAQDPQLEKTKNSRIVPSNLFYDLLVKDEKKNLVKGPEGQWQVIPDKLPELKQRLAKEYGISPNSILSYKEWDLKGKKIPNMKWNVIIAPGEPDLTAKDPGVLSTLLLKH